MPDLLNFLLNILRDPIWQFIGAFFALVSIWVIFRQRTRRILNFDIEDSISLISEHLKTGPLKILYRKREDDEYIEVDKAYMCSVVFINRGNATITPANFQKDVIVELTDEGDVVWRDVKDIVPPGTFDIKHKIAPSSKSVILTPFVLNENEEFTLKALIINGEPNVKPPTVHMIDAELKPFKYQFFPVGRHRKLLTGKGLFPRKTA